MNGLEMIRATGVPVGWGSILATLLLPKGPRADITWAEVASFAESWLAARTDLPGIPQGLVEFYGIGPLDRDALVEAVRLLAEEECADPSIEALKLRLAFLERQFADLPDDPVDGQIALTEFWAGYDYPADSPHLVQGLGTQSPPATTRRGKHSSRR